MAEHLGLDLGGVDAALAPPAELFRIAQELQAVVQAKEAAIARQDFEEARRQRELEVKLRQDRGRALSAWLEKIGGSPAG